MRVQRAARIIQMGDVQQGKSLAANCQASLRWTPQPVLRNTDSIKLGKDSCEVQRIPAGEIETVVVEKLRHVLRSPEVLAHAEREVASLRPRIGEADAIRTLQNIDPVWDELFPAEQANIVRTLVERITVRREGITIQWKDQGMNQLLRETLSGPTLEAA
jgi:site-specific DNA recombinase